LKTNTELLSRKKANNPFLPREKKILRRETKGRHTIPEDGYDTSPNYYVKNITTNKHPSSTSLQPASADDDLNKKRTTPKGALRFINSLIRWFAPVLFN